MSPQEASVSANATPSAAPRTRWPWRAPALLTLATVLAYGNSLPARFVLDDRTCIIDNPAIRTFPPPWTEVLAPRGLVELTLAANYALGGLNETGYHLFNIAVHLLAGLVLYDLVRRTLLRVSPDLPAADLACVVALLWLVHPLQTESVTYTIQRAEALMGLFYLLVLYTVLRGDGARSSVRRRLCYAGTVLACALGMLSKEVTATAPIVLLLYDRVYLSDSWRTVWRRRWALYLLLFAPYLFVADRIRMALSTQEVNATAGFSLASITPLQYALSQPAVILHYLRLAVWPLPQCLDYSWAPAPNGLVLLPSLLAVLAMLGLTGWLLWRAPKVGFLPAAFFLILAPTSSFLPIADLAVEHRMYLPLAPLLVLLVLGARRLLTYLARRLDWNARQRRQRAFALAVGVTCAGIALTVARNTDYYSALTMWGRVVEQAPFNGRALNNLGYALTEHGRYEEAEQVFRKVLTLADLPNPHSGLANALDKLGQPEEAITEFRAALALDPARPQDHLQLGTLLAGQGDYARAEKHLREALRLRPRHAPTLSNLATVLAAQGQYEAAIDCCREALAIDPNFARAEQNWASALAKLGKDEEALAHYRAAARLDPHNLAVSSSIGSILRRLGREDEAREYPQREAVVSQDY